MFPSGQKQSVKEDRIIFCRFHLPMALGTLHGNRGDHLGDYTLSPAYITGVWKCRIDRITFSFLHHKLRYAGRIFFYRFFGKIKREIKIIFRCAAFFTDKKFTSAVDSSGWVRRNSFHFSPYFPSLIPSTSVFPW